MALWDKLKGENSNIKFLILFLGILFLGACTYSNSSTQSQAIKNQKKNGLVKSYSKDGKIKSEINYKDGKRDGVGKSYYKNGEVMLEIPYVNGKREGLIKRYYENGALYRETEFVDDVQSGIQKTYRKNGKLKTECRFEAEEPCLGLREYLLDGSLKKKYPSIVTQIVDRVKATGVYTVYLSMSDGSGKVEFYKGKLSPGGCLTNFLLPLPYDKKSKRSELKYTIPVGGFMMEEVNIIAKVTTLLGGSYITQKKINIAVNN